MAARSVTDRIALLLGQWFFTGRSPKAPGTVGSVGAIPLFLLLREAPPLVYWGATLIVSLGGIAIAQRCAALLGDDDPSSVVIDEVAGVLIALGCVAHGPLWVLVLAWILFRVFDITKPWLVDKAQYLSPVGLGIMADDLLAGAVAGALSYAALAFLPVW